MTATAAFSDNHVLVLVVTVEEPAQPKDIHEDAQLFREVTFCPWVEQLGYSAHDNPGREANAEFAAALSSQNWEVLAYATQKDNGWWCCLLKKG